MPKIKGEKYPVWKTSIKYQGVFVMRSLYKETFEFLKDINYTDENRYRYMEEYYYEKRSSDPIEGRSLWIWWRTDKRDGVDVSSYYKFAIDVDFHVRFMKDVEAVVEGEKIKVQHGEVEILVSGYVWKDYNGTWSNHWLLKHLQDFWYKRLWSRSFEDKKHVVKEDMGKLLKMIKQFFELQSYLPLEGKIFVPSHGYREAEKKQ